MTIDYHEKGKQKIDMRSNIKDITETFPEALSDKVKCPWTTRLFNNNDNCQILNQHNIERFHTYVLKCMFLAKSGRSDILTGISVLTK